jgi:ankyrin repeat protein/energy-coupling factor transporter ATP-binding protein EcfA2
VATILEEVRNKSFVVITGPSGVGKSTIVKLVALQLQKTNDYHILPIPCPKDIVKYFDPNIKQIYIIDDICGKFSVDQPMINSWERVHRKILKYRKDNKEFRVLGTCRLEISISSPFRKLQEKYEITECNLLQKKFLYCKEEKLKVAACHIDEETIKQLDDKILNAYHMFPLLCMMYAASESNPGVRFFEYPLEAIEEQLDEMKEQNECHFIGLALIVVYNNKLHKLLLQNRNDQKFEDVYNDVFEDLGLVNRPSKRSVLSGLQTLEGIYVKELESTITVIHDKIFDIFSLYFGKRIPKTILTHGSGTFIAERFLFKSIEEDCDDLKIVLPSELEHSYFNRMVEEIENNRFYNVFENVQVRNELYQEKFISFLSKHAHQSIIQLLYNKWPLYLSAVNGGKLLVEFILNEKRTSGMCNKLDKDGNHQDMLKDKPESDMYACSFDSDTNSESKSRSIRDFPRLWNVYDTKDDKRTTEEDACRIQYENSPMVAACEGGYIDIVECLVKYGYYIDHSDTILPRPLFSACKYGYKDVVDFLLKRNCEVDAVDENGQTALHAACQNGNIDIVSSLLKCNNSVNLCDIFGFTPSYYACSNGHTDVVQILLDINCDIHDDAIYKACEGGYKDIVEIFIKHNVDIHLSGSWLGVTPIYYACLKGHTDVVQILLDNNCDIPKGAINVACKGGYKDIVEILIKHNVDINLSGGVFDHTPIYYACSKGHTDVVQILLDNNYDIHGVIHEACEEGDKDIVEILIKHDVDINLRGGFRNHTPIYYACSNGHTDVVQILLDNNCDIHGAIHEACEGGYKDIVEILIKHDVDINLRGGFRNQTPIYYACSNGHTDVVQILLDNNCDIHGAIHGACEGGYKDIVEILIKNNVDINQHCGHTDIVKLLLDNNCDVLDNEDC